MSWYLRFKQPITAVRTHVPGGSTDYYSLDFWIDGVGFAGVIFCKTVNQCNMLLLTLVNTEQILLEKDLEQWVFSDGITAFLVMDRDQDGLYIIKQLSEIKSELYAKHHKPDTDAGGEMVHPGGGEDGPQGDR